MKKLLFIFSFLPFLLLCPEDTLNIAKVSTSKATNTRYVTFENNLAEIANVDHENGDAWESAVVYMNNVIFYPGEEKKVLLRKNDICLRIEIPLNKCDDLGGLFGGKTETVFNKAPFLQSLINKLPDQYTISCHINFQLEDDHSDKTFLEFAELVCHLVDLLKNDELMIRVRPQINPQPGLRINLYYKNTKSI